MRVLADRIAGTPDWHEVISTANKDHPLTEEAMRQTYEVWTARARDFLLDRGAVADVSETAAPWSQLLPLYRRTVAAAEKAFADIGKLFAK